MSKPKYIQVMVIAICLLTLKASVLLSSQSEQSIRPRSPRLSQEDEQKRIEAELKRLDQPPVRHERQLLDDMENSMERYYRNKNISSEKQLESLLEQILALPKPSAEAYSVCATTANVLGRPNRAIAVLKKAITEYPEERVGGTILPLKVSGYYRIGAIATRISDTNEAVQAYKTIIGNLSTIEGKEYYKIQCYMYLADITNRIMGEKQLAVEYLQEIVRIIDNTDMAEQRHNGPLLTNLLRNWATYELEKIEHNSVPADLFPDPNRGESAAFSMMALMWTLVCCPSRPEFEQMAELNDSSILSILARFGLAVNYLHHANLNPVKAENYLLSIAQVDSYFKPHAKVMLDIVREEMEKIREKIPILLNDLKQGDTEQRQSAAFRLTYEVGPEGIKVLQDAQQDPNKYVRYMAACVLAQRVRDPSIKVDFKIVLEAITDENPQVRRQAQSAIDFHQCLDVGPKEIVALIRLMNEHYSSELTWTLSEFLFSSRTNPEILDAALQELAILMDHESKDVRSGVLEIFHRLRSFAVKATDALTKHLEKKADEDEKIRIIGMLGGFGAAGEQAIPELTKCLKDDNENVRRHAADALKKISRAKSSQSPQTTSDP